MAGYVQVYTGDGKGKTTAAIGLAVRACGAGLRVYFAQFIKAGDSSEIRWLQKFCSQMRIEAFGRGRFLRGRPAPEDLALASQGLERLRQAVTSGEFDLVVADEANGAVQAGLLSISDLLALIDIRKPDVELVFTGRNAHPELIERADLVTELRAVKHYLNAGVPARKGIEV